MKEDMFNELVASVREGGAILRGEAAPSRKFVIAGPDVKRNSRSWLQGRRRTARWRTCHTRRPTPPRGSA